MRVTLAEIAKIVEGEIVGDHDITITGLSGIQEAKKGDLTFVANSKYIPLIKHSKASALLVPKTIQVAGKPFIRTDNPSLAFAKVISTFVNIKDERWKGIHETAVIGKKVILGREVTVGPYCVLEDGVTVGDHTMIYSGSFIGHQTTIGHHTLIYPQVTIRERITVGNHVIIHSGTVIGSDGFGFEDVDGELAKIPQIGTVIIEDNVEIGANVTVDRARFDKTIIGKGTKIDNLVQIAHNVIIKENCIIVSQVGISGSVKIERGVIIAGQAGVVGHLTIGEGAIIAAKAGVTKSIPAHTTVSGYPAQPHDETKKLNALYQRLPKYVKKIEILTKKVNKLDQKLKRCLSKKQLKKRSV